jgi:hypothetical protein
MRCRPNSYVIGMITQSDRRVPVAIADLLGAIASKGALCLALSMACFVQSGCAPARTVRFDGADAAITVKHPALYPETLEYDSVKDRFLLGSFREGAIYEVDLTGKASLLVDDPRLCSVLGIAVDAARRRLWAVNSDLGASTKPSVSGPKKLAGVGIYDLSTGEPLQYVDLSQLAEGPHLANGIALAPDGTAYVSDSFSPVIYKVSPEGTASVFLRDDRFAGSAVNLNGLAVHPDGYLLVVKKSDGSLFKIPLARPSDMRRVSIPRNLTGGDGLTLAGGGKELVVIANRTPEYVSDAAISLHSEDGWATAQISAEHPLGDVYPTTAVVRQGALYVVHSKLNALIALPPEQKARLREEAVIRSIGRVGR